VRNIGVVGFHGFSERLTVSGSTIISDVFVKAVRQLIDLGYKFRTLSQYDNSMETEKCIYFYFDDCDLSIYDIIIKKLDGVDFKATLFPISDYIDENGNFDVINKKRKLMGIPHLKDLIEKGFEIGSHSATHIPLGIKKNEKFWNYEVIESKQKIEELLDTKVNSFSAPFGSYNKRLIDFVVDNGYKNLISINRTIKSNNSLIVGYPAYNLDSIESLKIKAIGGDVFTNINSLLYNQFSKGSILLKSF